MLSTLRQRIDTAHDYYELPRWKLLMTALKTRKNIDSWSLEVAQAAYAGREYYHCTTGRCIIVWEPRTEGHKTVGPWNCACNKALDPRGEQIQ